VPPDNPLWHCAFRRCPIDVVRGQLLQTIDLPAFASPDRKQAVID
jgi:hypothetical protein